VLIPGKLGTESVLRLAVFRVLLVLVLPALILRPAAGSGGHGLAGLTAALASRLQSPATNRQPGLSTPGSAD